MGTKTILNVDGLDWKRDKWPTFAKQYIQLTEYLATKLPTTYLTDSRVVQNYYINRFKSNPHYIPYGSEVDNKPPGETLNKFGLEPHKYVLFVGRLVPENCAHHLVEAFTGLDTDLKCVIVGDAAYAHNYITSLKSIARNETSIVFTGYVFGEGYQEIGSNALIFVETSGVGGTHPALVEAMAFGNAVIVNNTAENLETIGSDGFSYEGKLGANSLSIVLEQLISDRELTDKYRERAKARAQTYYTWEAVTDAYERLFFSLTGEPLPTRLCTENQSNVYFPKRV
jgi:glycosyltransferase involved in cell wall biosynthesis